MRLAGKQDSILSLVLQDDLSFVFPPPVSRQPSAVSRYPFDLLDRDGGAC